MTGTRWVAETTQCSKSFRKGVRGIGANLGARALFPGFERPGYSQTSPSGRQHSQAP